MYKGFSYKSILPWKQILLLASLGERGGSGSFFLKKALIEHMKLETDFVPT
jgi:hypothetical protein